MDRLTKRTVAGTVNLAYPDSCYFKDGNRDQVSSSAYRQTAIERLADYEDTELSPETVNDLLERFNSLYKMFDDLDLVDRVHFQAFLERVRRWRQAEKDGRLVVLPCMSDTVYTIEEDYFNCDECIHGSSAYFKPEINRVSCDMDAGVHCPLYIKEHEASGFEVKFDTTGNVILSLPGEFGYEGLEQFMGIDGKCYYTRAEAEAALKKREADDEND